MAESGTEFKFGTWYDIESAPRNGQVILFPTKRFGNCPRSVSWRDCPFGLFGEAWRPLDDPQRALKSDVWMPLPPPPQSE